MHCAKGGPDHLPEAAQRRKHRCEVDTRQRLGHRLGCNGCVGWCRRRLRRDHPEYKRLELRDARLQLVVALRLLRRLLRCARCICARCRELRFGSPIEAGATAAAATTGGDALALGFEVSRAPLLEGGMQHAILHAHERLLQERLPLILLLCDRAAQSREGRAQQELVAAGQHSERARHLVVGALARGRRERLPREEAACHGLVRVAPEDLRGELHKPMVGRARVVAPGAELQLHEHLVTSGEGGERAEL